ncbi:hypothetical protein N7478_012537 [Penicillium angulare]|uniref:uncharacterized protein n=1 Tax=Penicillium angulare TaxID=116970 RepID=UPI00253FD94D|nr:uncharacterized protein N7478_012537 [Penicillium angulare]KAJ5259556.1 hypothetical protein N7478_012537 [Penicillium angulare]
MYRRRETRLKFYVDEKVRDRAPYDIFYYSEDAWKAIAEMKGLRCLLVTFSSIELPETGATTYTL